LFPIIGHSWVRDGLVFVRLREQQRVTSEQD